MFFYHLLWTLIGGPLILSCRFNKNPRLRERLAYDIPRLSIKSGGIWVHALSVGEVKSAISLVARIRKEYPEKSLVFSSTTRQGLELACEELVDIADLIITMPLDFWWSCQRVVRSIRPNIFILVETDLWPGLLNHLSSRGIQSLLVNGRISDRTLRSYRKAPRLARRLYRDLRLCLMQTYQDRDRLLSIGLPSHKVMAVGNIKFDRPWAPMSKTEKQQWRTALGINEQALVWVAGSTHGEESRIVLNVFFELQSLYPELVLILAPRRIEEASALYSMVVEREKTCILRSQQKLALRSPDVVILDTVGELERIYGLGHMSFVGGSLVPYGGHNLLEPAGFGIPVVYGPNTSNFAWMAEALSRAGGGIRVTDAGELKRALTELIRNEELRRSKGNAALSFVNNNQGALNRVMKYIGECLAPEALGFAH